MWLRTVVVCIMYCSISLVALVHIQDLIALLTDEQDSTQIAEEFFNSNRKITAGFIENLENWKSLIIIFPMRLGGESFNMSYQSLITGVLSMPSCVGIIGGRPKHSLYFVGYQGLVVISQALFYSFLNR